MSKPEYTLPACGVCWPGPCDYRCGMTQAKWDDHDRWSNLSAEMAVQSIKIDLQDYMGADPAGTAQKHRDEETQVFMRAKYEMGKALIALKDLGYEVKKR